MPPNNLIERLEARILYKESAMLRLELFEAAPAILNVLKAAQGLVEVLTEDTLEPIRSYHEDSYDAACAKTDALRKALEEMK